MTVSCVASASSRVWLRAVMAGLFGSAICLLAPEGRAQTTVIGDVTVTGNATIKGDATVEGGLTVHDAANLGGINITNSCLACGINMGGSNIFNANNVTASGTIQGGTLTDGTASISGGNITGVGTITGGTGTFTTVNATNGGFGTLTATTGNITTVNATDVDATNVNATNGGFGTLTATTGNITTVNATDVNATNVKATNGTFTTLKTTGDATVGGDLTVTNQSNLNGGAIIGNHLTVLPGTKVSMGNNVVHGVADPEIGSDAANKQYVDAGLSRAFRDIDRNTQGIAIAMAMGGMALPDSKNFALGANLGFFDSKQAMAIQGAMRLTPFVSVNGGIGMGLDDSSTLGGRVGVQVAW